MNQTPTSHCRVGSLGPIRVTSWAIERRAERVEWRRLGLRAMAEVPTTIAGSAAAAGARTEAVEAAVAAEWKWRAARRGSPNRRDRHPLRCSRYRNASSTARRTTPRPRGGSIPRTTYTSISLRRVSAHSDAEEPHRRAGEATRSSASSTRARAGGKRAPHERSDPAEASPRSPSLIPLSANRPCASI